MNTNPTAILLQNSELKFEIVGDKLWLHPHGRKDKDSTFSNLKGEVLENVEDRLVERHLKDQASAIKDRELWLDIRDALVGRGARQMGGVKCA